MAAYLAWLGLSLLPIHHKTVAVLRLLISPCFDLAFISFAIILDGGQSSGLLLFYFIIILGYGIHFGNPILLYTQATSLVAYLCTYSFIHINSHFNIDSGLFTLQLMALIIIPTCIYQVNKKKRPLAKSAGKPSYADLLEFCPIAAFTFQQDHKLPPRILYANPAMLQIYRDDIVHLIGEQVDIIALMEDGAEIIAACQATFTNQAEHTKPFYIRGRNNQDEILKLQGQCQRIDKTHAICFLINLNQQTNLQRLYQAQQGTLISAIVHDFRNILTGIIGSAEVLQFTTQEPNHNSLLNAIIQTGEHGSEFTNQLLKKVPTQDNSGITSLPYHYNQLHETIGQLRLQLPHHIQLKFDLDQNLPSINIAKNQFEQIIISLVNNASEAISEAGLITIQLKSNLQHQLSNNHTPALQVNVSDNGCGMSPETLESATQALWCEPKKAANHLGVGLNLVKRIINQCGGMLELNSTEGLGSQVTISLPPYSQSSSSHHKSRPEPIPTQTLPITTVSPADCSEAQDDPLDTWSILLVDDNPDVLKVHQHLLECMGLEVTTAEHAKQALKLWQDRQTKCLKNYDLLITDYRMPGMDGVELCHHIRRKDSNLPILMITAYGEAKKLQEATQIQVNILNKPVSYKKLKQQIALIQERAKPTT
ncbi:MAG: response regulator [Mariprofundaceae bacterium]